MHVLGFHFIFTAYGFWLPNDPRGSWSQIVRALHLQPFGPATKVHTTHSLARKPYDHRLRLEARQHLKHPAVTFNGMQARAIARGFSIAITEYDYKIHALAIMPDHVHLIMAWHPRPIDQIASHLKAKATHRLATEDLHPLAAFANEQGRKPSPWSRGHWCPYLKNEKHMATAIRYVNANPIKSGLKPQRWNLVTPWRNVRM